MVHCSLLFLLCCNLIIFSLAAESNSVLQTRIIADPGFIESNGSLFRLGFFSPNGSTNRYVGIWYNKAIHNVLWVANRQNPLNNSNGVFRISEQGNLVVLSGENEILWSTNVSVSDSIGSNSINFRLMDSGNLVLQGINGDVLWQSFDFPEDALWPPIKLSTNLKTGVNKFITSWMNISDPSYGNFTVGIIVHINVPEVYIRNNGEPHWRSGPWNGKVFKGVLGMNSVDRFRVASEDDGTTYLSVTLLDDTFFTVFQITSAGVLVESSWEDGAWITSWSTRQSVCDDYAMCGAFGICSATNASVCSCMRGFKPRNADEWKLGDWTNGCVRTSELSCNRTSNKTSQVRYEEDGFFKLRNVKVSDHIEWWPYNEETCSSECLQNCTCVAYAYEEGIGCMTWSGELIDVQEFVTEADGIDLYLRVPRSELADETRVNKVIIIVSAVVGSVEITTIEPG